MTDLGEDVRPECALVLGGGIAGLAAALNLAKAGFRVDLLERDEEPDDPDDPRQGVPHAVHPHFFMGRVRQHLAQYHPEVLERLAELGAGERPFEKYIHPAARASHRSLASDARLVAIAARRTTFERALRESVQAQDRVTIHRGARVDRLSVEPGEPPRVVGAEAAIGDRSRRFAADLVVDASGRGSRLAAQLEGEGVCFEVEQHDCNLLYFTRWYELLEGRDYPSASGLPGLQYGDFVVGALPADNGAFTVTFQVQKDDVDMIRVVRSPETFQALCEELPAMAAWTSLETARATSGVHGFGSMDGFWQQAAPAGVAHVHGLYFLGDTALRTNPRFGRGCTWAILGAHALCESLESTRDPSGRLVAYEHRLRQLFRTDWEDLRGFDHAARRAFEVETGRRSARWRDRVARAFGERVSEAMIVDPAFFRRIWTGYHGFGDVNAWTRSPAVWLRLARFVLGRRRHRELLRVARGRPSRDEILALAPTMTVA